MLSKGYSSRSVCLSVCLFVCLSATILALQATRRLMSDTNSFSATSALQEERQVPTDCTIPRRILASSVEI